MSPLPSTLLVAAVVLSLASWDRVSAVNVSVPIVPPANSQTLSPTLVSFSIEQDRWPDWVGISARNNFTYNALSNYAALTGQPPNMRVGADSEDHTYWSPTETFNKDTFPTLNSITPYPEATHITVGDSYYDLSRYLPHGTHMVWGVNLAANNTTNAVNMAKAIAQSFDNADVQAAGIVLDRIEVGNEPDLYVSHKLRPKGWTVKDYVNEWQNIAGQVVQAMGISGRGGPVTLQGAAFANQGFTPSEIYNLNILQSTPGQAISVISQHHYSAHFCKGGNFSLASFMNKAAIRSNFSIFEKDIAATRAHGLQWILGETNSIACHGAPGVSNTAGSALWAIDYALHAASLGIKEAYFHEGVGYKYNFIQPVPLNVSIVDGSPLDPPAPPQILPSYYGGLVVNTFIGSSGSANIVELSVNDTNVSGYAAFEDGQLARAVFVNLHAWLKNTAGQRPSIRLSLGLNGTMSNLSAYQSRNIVARRLVIQHADDTANLTWAGQTFETTDALPSNAVVQENVVLDDGLDLQSSEAVLLEFLSQPGSSPSGSQSLSSVQPSATQPSGERPVAEQSSSSTRAGGMRSMVASLVSGTLLALLSLGLAF